MPSLAAHAAAECSPLKEVYRTEHTNCPQMFLADSVLRQVKWLADGYGLPCAFAGVQIIPSKILSLLKYLFLPWSLERNVLS